MKGMERVRIAMSKAQWKKKKKTIVRITHREAAHSSPIPSDLK